jgi:hypothetical protein
MARASYRSELLVVAVVGGLLACRAGALKIGAGEAGAAAGGSSALVDGSEGGGSGGTGLGTATGGILGTGDVGSDGTGGSDLGNGGAAGNPAAGGSASGGITSRDGGNVSSGSDAGGVPRDGPDTDTATGGASTGGTGAGGRATGGDIGTGEAFLELDRSSIDFSSLGVGTSSGTFITLTNRGGSASGVPSIMIEIPSISAGSVNSVTVQGCETAVPANASCRLTINVSPSALGLFQAFVRITASPGAPSTSPLSISIVGRAIGFEVQLSLSMELGNLAPAVSVERSITITSFIALSDLEVWTAGDDISIVPSASTCTATLADHASCVVTVEFMASDIGWKRDILGIKAGGDYGQVVNLEITANVSKASDLAVLPSTPQSFVCVFEQTSPAVVFAVTNLASTRSGTIATTIAGEDAGDFLVSRTNCAILAPQASCTVEVVCSPPMSASSATRHAVLSVTDGNTHLAVPLSAEVTLR